MILNMEIMSMLAGSFIGFLGGIVGWFGRGIYADNVRAEALRYNMTNASRKAVEVKQEREERLMGLVAGAFQAQKEGKLTEFMKEAAIQNPDLALKMASKIGFKV